MASAFLDLPPLRHARGEVPLPGSKSISNRVLLLAALSRGATELRELLASDDTDRMLEALRALGVSVRQSGVAQYHVTGVGLGAGTDSAGRGSRGFPNKRADLFLGNAGTALRPLTAVLALSDGHYTLSGVPRMHERPIADLVDALRPLGADIAYLGNPGFPPLEIKPAAGEGATSADTARVVRVKGDVSSQFLTALLMALPAARAGTTIEVVGELISKPYIEMTLRLMAQFGVRVRREGWQRFEVPGDARYTSPGAISIEGDASSASYFLAAGAIGGGPVRVTGVGRDSLQGDIAFAAALETLGAQVTLGDRWIEAQAPAAGRLRAFDLDANHIPDAAMTLAVTALFCDGPCRLTNIASWRVKETDRIAAMATELRKVGAVVHEGNDWLRIAAPSRLIPNASIDTYEDHRMAMCFSLVALGGVPVRINDPDCVAKTFPTYFAAFHSIAQS